jgi:hypothetical protein
MARLKNMTKIYEWMYFDCWGMFVTFTMLVFLYILEIHCVIWGNINSISMQEVEDFDANVDKIRIQTK